MCHLLLAGYLTKIKLKTTDTMFRICITIIAYIVSFVSHSNELPEMGQLEEKVTTEKVMVVVELEESSSTEEDLIVTDLN